MTAVIEMPKNTIYKYEQDKKTGALVVDRVLNQVVPCNYGYLKGTLSPDGDALDVFVLSTHPIHPLTEVQVIPIALLICTDNGVSDDKIIAQIVGDVDSGAHCLDQIIEYLESYKPGFKVLQYGTPSMVRKVIDKSMEAFKNTSFSDADFR